MGHGIWTSPRSGDETAPGKTDPDGRPMSDLPSAVLEIRARPGARREGIARDPWTAAWVVTVPAPARDGAANRAILRLVAERLSVPEAALEWVAGARGRRKLLRVRGLSPAEAARRLASEGNG